MAKTPSTPPGVYEGNSEASETIRGANRDGIQLFTPITTSSNKVVEMSQTDVDERVAEKMDDMGETGGLGTPTGSETPIRHVNHKPIEASISNDEDYLRLSKIRNSKGNDFLARLAKAAGEDTRNNEVQDDENLTTEDIMMTPANKMVVLEDSDCDTSCDEVFIKREELRNPFFKESPESKTVLRKRSRLANKVDYSKELELVNHKTGEKIIKKLSPSQAKIKPRKLKFDQVIEDEKLLRGVQDYNDKYMMKNSSKLHKLSSARSLCFDIYDDNKDN